MPVGSDLAEVQRTLNRHGFLCGRVDGRIGPRTLRGIRHFQAAYAGGRDGVTGTLAIDGIPGLQTRQAITDLPWLSPHFRAGEFACRHCGQVVLERELVLALEGLRRANGRRPLRIVSGYRCPAHNSQVGGAARSQHLYGTASDLDYPCRVQVARAVGVFSGLGHKGGMLRHADVRHARSDTNPTPGATPTAPALWRY